MKKWMPNRKVLAGGLASVVAFFVVLGLGAVGVAVEMETAIALVAAVGPAVSYLIPAPIVEHLEAADEFLKGLDDDKAGA